MHDAVAVGQALDRGRRSRATPGSRGSRTLVALERRGERARPARAGARPARWAAADEVARAGRRRCGAPSSTVAITERRARDRRRVHLAQDAEAELLDEAALLLLDRRLAGARPGTRSRAVAERLVQRDRLGEADVRRCRSVCAARCAPAAARRATRAPSPRPPTSRWYASSSTIAAVVDRHRHQVEVAPHALRRTRSTIADSMPSFGVQDLAGAAAAALDEELLRVALADEERRGTCGRPSCRARCRRRCGG